jgi:hypothetical protein
VELLFLKILTHPAVVWVLRSKVVTAILSRFVDWMQFSDDNRDEWPPYIFLISYAATSSRLTNMSRNTTGIVAYLVKQYYPTSTVIACSFRDNPHDALEAPWKKELLGHGVKFIYAGRASSTTDEREFLVGATNGYIKKSIVVGNGAHIRRARMVWSHFHPKANLRFVSTNMNMDDDPENPMLAQRYWQVWMVANLVGLIGYRLIGVERLARKNFSQPVAS